MQAECLNCRDISNVHKIMNLGINIDRTNFNKNDVECAVIFGNILEFNRGVITFICR